MLNLILKTLTEGLKNLELVDKRYVFCGQRTY
jgi:hypothetical protein